MNIKKSKGYRQALKETDSERLDIIADAFLGGVLALIFWILILFI